AGLDGAQPDHPGRLLPAAGRLAVDQRVRVQPAVADPTDGGDHPELPRGALDALRELPRLRLRAVHRLRRGLHVDPPGPLRALVGEVRQPHPNRQLGRSGQGRTGIGQQPLDAGDRAGRLPGGDGGDLAATADRHQVRHPRGRLADPRRDHHRADRLEGIEDSATLQGAQGMTTTTTRRTRAALALAAALSVLLSGCGLSVDVSAADQEATPVATPSKNPTPYPTQFTNDGTFQSHTRVRNLDFVYTLWPTKATQETNLWFPRGNKHFSFSLSAYDLNRK